MSVKIEDAKTKRVVWSQVAKGHVGVFLTQDLQFNRVLQNRALEQAGRRWRKILPRFLLFLDAGELDKVLKRPVKAEGPGNPPQPGRCDRDTEGLSRMGASVTSLELPQALARRSRGTALCGCRRGGLPP